MEIRRLRPPPAIKVLEASGAIGGGRVRVLGEVGGALLAVVRSSGRRLEYRVAVKLSTDGRVVRAYSTDNGTLYRGYVGYPIVSLMMLGGALPRDSEVERALASVNWYELNRKTRSYARAMQGILSGLDPTVRRRAEVLVDSVMAKLRSTEVLYDGELAKLFT